MAKSGNAKSHAQRQREYMERRRARLAAGLPASSRSADQAEITRVRAENEKLKATIVVLMKEGWDLKLKEDFYKRRLHELHPHYYDCVEPEILRTSDGINYRAVDNWMIPDPDSHNWSFLDFNDMIRLVPRTLMAPR